jgi:hypothetical protein
MGMRAYPATHPNQTPNAIETIPGVSRRAIMFVVKMETT